MAMQFACLSNFNSYVHENIYMLQEYSHYTSGCLNFTPPFEAAIGKEETLKWLVVF